MKALYDYVLEKLDNGARLTVLGMDQSPDEYAKTLAVAGLVRIISWKQVAGGPMDYPIYRLILETSPGRVDTGGTYPGCMPREHPEWCDPQQFGNTSDAFAYATAHQEIPLIVHSAEEGWIFAENEERARQLQQQYTGPSGSPAPTPGQGGPLPVGGMSDLSQYLPYALGGLALWFLMKKMR